MVAKVDNAVVYLKRNLRDFARLVEPARTELGAERVREYAVFNVLRLGRMRQLHRRGVGRKRAVVCHVYPAARAALLHQQRIERGEL